MDKKKQRTIKIKTRLMEMDKTQKELASEININKIYLNEIITGKKGGAKYYVALSKALNMPIEELMI